MEKVKNRACIFFCIFILGLTLGSAVAVGEEWEIAAESGFPRIFFKNLPFVFFTNLWGSKKIRMLAGSAALTVKGMFFGVSAVNILKYCPAKYPALMLPQTALLVPAMVMLMCVSAEKEHIAASFSAVLTKILLSILLTFLISCVQFGLCFYFPQIYG